MSEATLNITLDEKTDVVNMVKDLYGLQLFNINLLIEGNTVFASVDFHKDDFYKLFEAAYLAGLNKAESVSVDGVNIV